MQAIIYSIFLFLIAVICYKFAVKFYITWWYYTRQGVACPFKPLPFLGNILKLMEYRKNQSEFDQPGALGLLSREYPMGFPKAILHNFKIYPSIMINDCELAGDIYVARNRYFDRHPLFQEYQKSLIGNSIVTSHTDEVWAAKRKSIGQVFYKGRMTKMNQITIRTALDCMSTHMDKYENGQESSIYFEVQRVMLDCLAASLLSKDILTKTLTFTNIDGTEKEVKFVEFSKLLISQYNQYVASPGPRLYVFFKIEALKGRLGRIFQVNMGKFKVVIKEVIDSTRVQVEQGFGEENFDVVTELIRQGSYQQDTEGLINDIVSLIIVGFHTNTRLLVNSLYYATRFREMREQIRGEIAQFLVRDGKRATPEEWIQGFSSGDLDNLEFTGRFIHETLRLHPPVPQTFSFTMMEDCYIGDIFIKKYIDMTMNIQAIQTDPKQWWEPMEFIPDRFDFNSKYFRTPSGEKRHPYSFCPFFGGRRSCVGKSFAELLGKTIFSIMVAKYDFEFVKEEHYKQRPVMGHMVEQKFPMLVRVYQARD